MHFEKATQILAGVPHMTQDQARIIYDFILDKQPERILELGFAHGVSSCYMAAALDEIGGDGHVLTIDQHAAERRKPRINDLLDECGLAHRVTPVFGDTYIWELMRLLEQDPVPSFDFVFIDGAHTWDIDGFAFLLADRMLKPGGWVLFDDLDWTFATSPALKDQPWVKALPEVQRTTPQVRKVFELLVKSNPGYDSFRDERGWGWARKRPAGGSRRRLRVLNR